MVGNPNIEARIGAVIGRLSYLKRGRVIHRSVSEISGVVCAGIAVAFYGL
jgi:hypothetical protein